MRDPPVFLLSPRRRRYGPIHDRSSGGGELRSPPLKTQVRPRGWMMKTAQAQAAQRRSARRATAIARERAARVTSVLHPRPHPSGASLAPRLWRAGLRHDASRTWTARPRAFVRPPSARADDPPLAGSITSRGRPGRTPGTAGPARRRAAATASPSAVRRRTGVKDIGRCPRSRRARAAVTPCPSRAPRSRATGCLVRLVHADCSTKRSARKSSTRRAPREAPARRASCGA